MGQRPALLVARSRWELRRGTTALRALGLALFGQDLDVHDFLLIDDRGRGFSNTIDCGELQHGTAPFAQAEGDCAAQLGDAASSYGTGNIIVGVVKTGPDIPVFRVDGTGRVFADGGFQPSGADFAESIAVTGDSSKYVPGDLLVIDPTANRHLALAQQPYSTLVAGIYSTKPGILGSTCKWERRRRKRKCRSR